MGSAEGQSPLAGYLRACHEPVEGVSLRYDFPIIYPHTNSFMKLTVEDCIVVDDPS